MTSMPVHHRKADPMRWRRAGRNAARADRREWTGRTPVANTSDEPNQPAACAVTLSNGRPASWRGPIEPDIDASPRVKSP